MLNRKKIIIPEPAWGSSLTGVILDLEKLRSKELYGEVPPHIFFQLKNIFQILETLGSARIEGNNTTLSEYVEKILDKKVKKDESQREIENLDKAISFIEENTNEQTLINRAYISELHKIVTKDLTLPPMGEGSRTPGELRKCEVIIKSSKHKPPTYAVLPDYFEGLIDLINRDLPKQYQLLMVAVAHHRFAYIHPFDNGNGRMGRLLNYALLIKLGFKVKAGRIINPSSIFYIDRDRYYEQLSLADSLEDKDILSWSEYFLTGLKNEIEKIDSLLEKGYVREKILLPAITFARDREQITKREFDVLKLLISKDKMQIKSEELDEVGVYDSFQKSRIMAKLRSKNIIEPLRNKGRIYTINFVNNYLLRGIMDALREENFVSDFLNRHSV